MHEKAEGREKERLKKEEREVGSLDAVMLYRDRSLISCREGCMTFLNIWELHPSSQMFVKLLPRPPTFQKKRCMSSFNCSLFSSPPFSE